MTKRHIRQERRAAQERDHSWTEERDTEPDEYPQRDDDACPAKDFRE